ncbi:calcium-binding protein [Halomonas sp. A020]|uniref:calcium-binding protein n=1 Tax=Halomonas sp. A020 TaxID=2717374 RepID=UPI00249117CB|nr:calcium-binding protein [Halomonas sp. A020]
MAKSSADMLKSTRPGVMSGHLLNGVRVSHQEAQSDWDSLANTRDDVVRIDVPADPQERMAFVRRWMANNQKALKQGGMAATLVLPLLAQQALADQMVAVNDLQGVAEVIRQPNGSLTLIMNSGQRIDMAAADVALENGRVVVDIDSLMELLGNDSGLLVPLSQLPDVQTWELLPDGNVLITRPDGTQMVIERGALVQQGDLFLISPSNALQQGIASGEDFGNLLFVPSASFANQPSSTSSFPSTASSSSEPVSSFGDIPPWLYVGGGAIAVGAAAAGGGGGGGGGDGGPATISGYVVDGYISGATVTRAVNSNQVTTNDDGFFSGLQGSGILTATGGVDISTGLPFTGVLRAPEDATVITPLTTLMVQLSQQFGLNDADAQTAIKTALGLDQRIDLMTTDPLAEASPNLDLLIAGVKVASLLAMVATAGISSADALSRLGTAFNQASDAGRELTNQEMADALGLPSIAGQVKQALDAIDNASDGLNIDAYRDGNNNPLRDAQRNAQDPNSDLSDTIGTRAEVPYLTLQQAVALAANDELPANYLINPNQPFAAGTLGLTAAGNQLALVETVLAGDFDVATAPIALGDIYTWSIRADAEDVLVSGGLGRPEVVGAQSVTLTNTTIRPDQFADLNTLDNFDLGSTVVPYTLEQALATDVMPANYTLNPSRPFSAGDLTVREAAELIDSTRVLLDLAQNTDSDNLTRDLLLEWNIVDSLATILGTPSARPQIAEANSISVTEAIITPAQFVQLNALPNFVLGETEVDYTLAEALAADPLASNYIIDLQEVLSAGTVTVAQAETAFADVSRVLEGANNQPPLTLFEWVIRDTADAIIADLDQGHVTEANQVSASNRVISSAQFDQLNTLDNFELGTTIVRYTLENAVNADELAANYDIDTTVPFEAGEVSVDAAATTLAAVERILDGALNTQTPNADALFNWTVVDSASAILAAGNVPHLTRADAVNVSDDIITIAQFEALSTADFNYIRLGELVEYTLANAISVIDAGNGPLVVDYVIDLETSFNDVWTVAQGASYFAIIAGAENRTALLGSDAVVWQVEDSIGNLLDGISNVNAGDTAFGDDAVVNAQTVRVTGTTITQAQYEELLGVLGNTLRLDAGESAVKTTVTYANLNAAVGAEAEGVLAPSEFYSITGNTPYTNPNGPLSVANALTDIETVKSILEGSTNRNAANFEAFYNWNITDSASNILAVIESSTSGIPEVLEGADSIFAANGGADGNILAAEYDALVNGLGEGGFDYNLVVYTLAYVFDNTDNSFAAPGDLANDYFFSEDQFDINEGLGVDSEIDIATAEAYISDVRDLIAGSVPEYRGVELTAIYQWSVVDSFAAINADLNREVLVEAYRIRLTDAAITSADYESLVNAYTLVEGNNPDSEGFVLGETVVEYTDMSDAVRAVKSDVLAPVDSFILVDSSTPYVAGQLSVQDAAAELTDVRTVLNGASGLENNDGNVQALFNWTVTDSASNIIQAINQAHVLLAESVTVTNNQITYAQYQSLVALDNYDYQSDPIEVLYTIQQALGVLEASEPLDKSGEGDDVSYAIVVPQSPFDAGIFDVQGAQALVQNTNAAIDGASNSDQLQLDSLINWSIRDAASVLLDLVSSNEEWLSGADVVYADLDEGNNFLTFEDYVSLRDSGAFSFDIDDTPVQFRLTSGIVDGTRELTEFYYVNEDTDFLDLEDLTVQRASADITNIRAFLDGAVNQPPEGGQWNVREFATWNIVDEPGSIINAIGTDAVVLAESVSLVANSGVTETQYLELSELDNFVFDNVYTLEDALAGADVSGDYVIDANVPVVYDWLSVSQAEEIRSDIVNIIDGAINQSDFAEDLTSIFKWQIQDEFANVRSLEQEFVVQNASNIRLTDNTINGNQNEEMIDAFGNRYQSIDGQVAELGSARELPSTSTEGTPYLITNFTTGAAGDAFRIGDEATEIPGLRGGVSADFAKYDDAQAFNDGSSDIAFAVFTTAEFFNDGTGLLANLSLVNDEVVYLLAGNGDTVEINDDAQLFRVEQTDTGFDTQLLANFENLDLNNFLDDNWNTNYSIT